MLRKHLHDGRILLGRQAGCWCKVLDYPTWRYEFRSVADSNRSARCWRYLALRSVRNFSKVWPLAVLHEGNRNDLERVKVADFIIHSTRPPQVRIVDNQIPRSSSVADHDLLVFVHQSDDCWHGIRIGSFHLNFVSDETLTANSKNFLKNKSSPNVNKVISCDTDVGCQSGSWDGDVIDVNLGHRVEHNGSVDAGEMVKVETVLQSVVTGRVFACVVLPHNSTCEVNKKSKVLSFKF